MTSNAVTIVPYAAADNNITKCELRISGNQFNNCTYEVSNDNGITWESLTPGEVHTFSSTGKNLRVKINLAESTAGVSPEFDSICVLYK